MPPAAPAALRQKEHAAHDRRRPARRRRDDPQRQRRPRARDGAGDGAAEHLVPGVVRSARTFAKARRGSERAQESGEAGAVFQGQPRERRRLRDGPSIVHRRRRVVAERRRPAPADQDAAQRAVRRPAGAARRVGPGDGHVGRENAHHDAMTPACARGMSISLQRSNWRILRYSMLRAERMPIKF